MDDSKERSLSAHKKHKGKIEISGKVALSNNEDLSIYYTPGVAHVSLAISNDREMSYEYTNRANTIAIVTDGSRVLGLGDLGPEAEMPVIEGKSLLFKKFGGIDAIPLAINSRNEDDVVNFAKMLEPSISAINIEDIKSPKVFNITKRLKEELGIPIFHDDRDGTAIVARAGLINALKLAKKKFKNARIVINGAGSAGDGIADILYASGAKEIIMCDTNGAIYKGREQGMDEFKSELAEKTNKNMQKGSLAEIAKGADVLIGVSARNAFSSDIIKSMNDSPIIFALANPYPEIDYDEAKAAGAFIAATGRSDRPNQINNYLAFPGFFRGMLLARVRKINMEMIIAASDAIASCVKKSQLSTDRIMPKSDNKKEYTAMTVKIAIAVAKAASESGTARINVDENRIKAETRELLARYSKIEKSIERLNKSDDA